MNCNYSLCYGSYSSLLVKSTNYLCNKRKLSGDSTKLTLFAVSKDDQNKKEDSYWGLPKGSMYLLGSTKINLAIVELHWSEGIRQLVS